MSDTDQIYQARRILSLDSVAGLLVGAGVLALHPILAGWMGLPPDVLLFTGVVNVVYGLYSGSLVVFTRSPALPGRFRVNFLIVANFLWAPVCLAIIAMHWAGIGWLGVTHFALEGAFVVFLSILEFRKVRPFTS